MTASRRALMLLSLHATAPLASATSSCASLISDAFPGDIHACWELAHRLSNPELECGNYYQDGAGPTASWFSRCSWKAETRACAREPSTKTSPPPCIDAAPSTCIRPHAACDTAASSPGLSCCGGDLISCTPPANSTGTNGTCEQTGHKVFKGACRADVADADAGLGVSSCQQATSLLANPVGACSRFYMTFTHPYNASAPAAQQPPVYLPCTFIEGHCRPNWQEKADTKPTCTPMSMPPGGPECLALDAHCHRSTSPCCSGLTCYKMNTAADTFAQCRASCPEGWLCPEEHDAVEDAEGVRDEDTCHLNRDCPQGDFCYAESKTCEPCADEEGFTACEEGEYTMDASSCAEACHSGAPLDARFGTPPPAGAGPQTTLIVGISVLAAFVSIGAAIVMYWRLAKLQKTNEDLRALWDKRQAASDEAGGVALHATRAAA